MARGFKVADAYVELTVDRDTARQAIRDIPRDAGPDADRAGRELGDRLTRGLEQKITALSAHLVKNRREESKATDAVKLAQLKLNEARDAGGQKASALLALEQRLTQAQQRLADAQSTTVTTTNRLGEAQRRLTVEMEETAKKAGPAAERSGQDLGGKLSQGIHMSIVRNSPLIVAAIGAALAIGAPVALAGATALFAGIGILAAAQSEKVKSAWLGTWQSIKAGAISDARPIEDVLVGLAGRVAAGFELMRPSLRNIFADAAPQITVFTDGILGLAQNALPGFERAVARGMPVTQGLADLLEKTGTGLTGFFDAMSAHSPAAGRAFSALGDVVATLLPILGELLGQGAELASIVLPAVVDVLGAFAGILRTVGPLLPFISTGLLGLKVAKQVADWVGTLGSKLTEFATKGGVAAGTAGRVGGALSGLSGAAGAAGLSGILVGLVAYFSQVENASTKWAEAIRQGGNAAEQAKRQMADWGQASAEVTSGWGMLIPLLSGVGGTMSATALAIDGTTEKLREQWLAMDPLAQAQSKVAEWSATLRDRMLDEGTSAGDLEAAKRRLAHWQSEAARLAALEAQELRGVTEAMVEQADQSRSLVDSQFAYENAVNGVEDAQTALNEAIRDHGASSEEAQRATLALNEALSAQAQAARRVAESNLPASMDDSQRAILGAKAELDELNRIAANYTLPPELEAHRLKLEAITGQANGAMLAQAQLAAAVGELGFAVSAVPGQKHITITAPTDALKAKLADLGFTIVQLPNGDIQVVAETEEAKNNLGNLNTLLVGLNTTTATPTVELGDQPFRTGWSNSMNLMRALHGQRPLPIASLNDGPLRGLTQADHGLLDGLNRARPTPVANLHNGALIASASASSLALNWLGGHRPTPVAELNTGPFQGGAGYMSGTMNWLHNLRASPWATLFANVSHAEAAINWAARNRTAYISVIQQIRNILPFGAAGGAVADLPVRRFAFGGNIGGKILGPGGPTEDRILMPTSRGPVATSNTEWIIKALSSMKYGDRRMAGVNAGVAQVLLPGEPGYTGPGGPAPAPRFARGGSPGMSAPPTWEVTTAPGRTVTVEHVSIHIEGTFDLASSSDLRKAALVLRQKIIDIERETS